MGDRRVIVIGSGPAGAAAALTLLRQGIPVTMLESGLPIQHGLVVRALGRNIYRQWPTEPGGYGFTSSGDAQTLWRSALAPGGLSNFWTGAVPRFAPQDFHEGERLHVRYRWPLDYDDLAPYYESMERLLGVVGESRDVPALPAPRVVHEYPLPHVWRELAYCAESFGQGLVRIPLADGPRWMVRRSGHAFNSYQGVVKSLSRFAHFRLVLGAHACRLEWNAALARVDAVHYVDRASGATDRIQAEAVVVAAGPLASTKLLLQSTSPDFPHGLGDRHGILGHFLHDHPNDWYTVELDRPLPVLDHNVYLTRAAYSESPPLMGAGVVIGGISKWDRVLSLTRHTARQFGVVTFGTMIPTYDNYVRLNPQKKDEFGSAMLDLHIRFGPDVESNVRAAEERLQAILSSAGVRATVSRPVATLTPGWAAHYGGTVRMHASPEYGVLNGWNRLHYADNVVVADASSFTTGVEKNPTLTVMALSARAADRLADDLKHDEVGGTPTQRNALSTIR